jgi:class 3 adenylate cyclase
MHTSGRRQEEIARDLTERIPGARLVQLETTEQFIWMGDTRQILEEIEEFLTGARHVSEPDRVLTTVMFTDIVSSTEHAGALGDAAWRELVAEHDRLVRAELERHRGREVKTMGDGFLATFDGPARGIRCAQAIVEEVQPLELQVRAGLHTGECELVGDDVRGMAVNIGARIGALGGPGEVLVSSTVKDLVVGSGIAFADRGVHELRGVPEEWQLFSVARVEESAGTQRVQDTRERRMGDRMAARATRRLPGIVRRAVAPRADS